jgi:8-oxo-dGTP pyrophosphatase MutT (NUDIX family)
MIIDYKQFPSGKQYACIRDGKSLCFLRNIAFLHPPGDPTTIVTVREWGSTTDVGMWEPPKGQMEWKEFAAKGFRKGQRITTPQLVAAMREGLLRELSEEAKILPSEIRDFQLLPMSYSEAFPAAGPHAEFRYQFWTGVVTRTDFTKAEKRMADLVGHPDIWDTVTPDKKEKDAVAWWSPKTPGAWKRIRGAFSGTMTRMYMNS